jgi:hypothetical protein
MRSFFGDPGARLYVNNYLKTCVEEGSGMSYEDATTVGLSSAQMLDVLYTCVGRIEKESLNSEPVAPDGQSGMARIGDYFVITSLSEFLLRAFFYHSF